MDSLSSSYSSESLWSGLEDLGLESWSLPETSAPFKGLAVTVLLLSLYTLYYLSCVVNKPKVVGGEGTLKEHLLKHCPCLSERYWPTIWAFHCHFTTILRAVFQKCPSGAIKYSREILPLDDGGEVALDWACLPAGKSTENEAMPVLLILPGITGMSRDNYVMHLVQDGILTGYRPVVFNQRGNGGLYLKTMRTYSASDIRDLCEVVHRVQCCYPEAPIVGLGVSLGGMILTQYAHQLGKECKLAAIISFSIVWDPFKTRESLENKVDNKVLYSRFITRNLRAMVKRNAERLSPEQLKELPFSYEDVMMTSTVSQFDHHLTAPLFGYSSVDEYYRDSRNSDKMYKICRPYICITAADDPFVPKDSIPESEFKGNPHTVLILTSHGGHFGFLEGMGPTIGTTWMNKISRQVLAALKLYDQK